MMMDPSGTFIGHLAPGIVFVLLGLYWVLIKFLHGPRSTNEPLERTSLVSYLKIIALFIGGYFEMPNSGWNPMDWVMGWHHITVYIAFMLSGIVDLLAKKSLLSPKSTYLAFSGAAFIGAMLFFGHGTGPGVEGTSHKIVLLLFFAITLVTILETFITSIDFEWYRIGLVLALGMWMGIISWILYLSGWDLHDHVREAQVWLVFSWMLICASILTTSFSILYNLKWSSKQKSD